MCRYIINTWETKTWRKRLAEGVYEYDGVLTTPYELLDILKKIVPSIKKREINDKWGHYCGFRPRYIRYSISGNEIMICGGEKWRLKLLKDEDGKWIEISDGCWSTEDVIDQLENGWPGM